MNNSVREGETLRHFSKLRSTCVEAGIFQLHSCLCRGWKPIDENSACVEVGKPIDENPACVEILLWSPWEMAAADSVRSEWLLWHAAKSNAVFARRRIEMKLKPELVKEKQKTFKRSSEGERERCASRRYLLKIIVNLICKTFLPFN
ncbi:hypothetical protein TNCV_4888241 [Trichonephila clavipes]|nr:hypothetical protein TNCV_4888241 [Trichonephila clavipes]